MSTIAEHVYALRELLKEHHDDSLFSDQFLYKILGDARVVLLERELNKFKRLSRWNFQSFCMPLESADYHDCESCIPASNCPILKSTYDIPEALVGNSTSTLEVKLLNGTPLAWGSVSANRHVKYSRYKKNVPSYTINNNKLIVLNNNRLKVVLVEGIFKDPASLADIKVCDTTGTPSNEICYDITTDPFPIEAKLVRAMYQLSLEMLRIPVAIPEDVTNDSQDKLNLTSVKANVQ